MNSTRRFDWFSHFQRNSLVALLSAITGCGEAAMPGVDSDIESGIWFMTSPWTRQLGGEEGKDVECRPMLLQLTITKESLVLGGRVFPCGNDWHSFEALSFQRSGDKLLRADEIVGTLNKRALEIHLPSENRQIVWNLDAHTELYTEITATNEFRMEPRWHGNEGPFATDVSLVGDEDTPVRGYAHAARLPGTIVTYQQLNSPFGGEIAYFDVGTGEFRFDPDINFGGGTSFSFQASADGWEPTVGVAHISFVDTQDPPIALHTYASGSEDSPTLIVPKVIDPDGDICTVELVDPPLHGTVETTFGSFLYTPDANYVGKDSFTFIASDGFAKSNVETVEMTVLKVNDPPVAIDQDVLVTAGSATPFKLLATDEDSSFLSYEILTFPQKGVIYGPSEDFVFVPQEGVMNGIEEISFRASDQLSDSNIAKLRFLISPGNYPCDLLTFDAINLMTPVWNDGLRIYYVSTFGPDVSYVGKTDGKSSGTNKLIEQFPSTSGFDNNVGASRHTTFYKQGPWFYFSTTNTTNGNLQLYRTDGVSANQLPLMIPPPENGLIAEPSVGDAFIAGAFAYLPLSWPRATDYVCQVWAIDEASIEQAALVHVLPPADGPCSGFWSNAGAQYMFAGSNLLQFAGMQSAPVIVKDLGLAKPEPWMVAVGDKLFFQTRTEVGSETRIDLWVTDGTEVGTKLIKELETAFLEFNVFSPIEFAGKLYFAHRKSLWSSDGTEAGTSIVATIPTSSVIGDGAIGTISAFNGKLFFMATSDAYGREPWVSDGTTAGTQLLADIRPGTKGSAIPSTNPVYFQFWNGQILFAADGGDYAWGLYSTDGTTAGTNLVTSRQIQTILGILGNRLIFRDKYRAYAMKLL